jgi:hypothetical protein
METRWNARNDGGNQWLQIDFGNDQTFNKTKISEAFSRTTSYNIQYWNGTTWSNCFSGQRIGTNKVDTFPTVTSSKIRLYINTVTSLSVSIFEFAVQLNNGPNLVTLDTLKINQNSQLGQAVFLKLPTASMLRSTLDSLVKVYDVKIEDNKKLRYIHKVKDSMDIYYFANPTNLAVNSYVRLRGKFELKALDPYTGVMTKPEYSFASEAGEDITRVKINLSAYKSCFLVSNLDSTLTNNKITKINNDTFKVYPNPMDQWVTINFGSEQYKELNIINMAGKIVKTLSIPNQSNEMKIDVSEFKKGAYCVNLLGLNSTNGKLLIK